MQNQNNTFKESSCGKKITNASQITGGSITINKVFSLVGEPLYEEHPWNFFFFICIICKGFMTQRDNLLRLPRCTALAEYSHIDRQTDIWTDGGGRIQAYYYRVGTVGTLWIWNPVNLRPTLTSFYLNSPVSQIFQTNCKLLLPHLIELNFRIPVKF